ncbi:MAG: hypothetical protein HY247_03120 [archaeon]|nr:MAG: hypothetical protein HY247_03120 [archaeon]
MIPEISFDTSTSMLKFHATADLRRYLKRALEANLREMDKVSDVIALVMRDDRIDSESPSVKGWVKAGTVFVNKSDPEKATLDVLFALTREIKPRIAQIQEALKATEKLESLGVDAEDALLLYTKFGMPERFIVIKTDAPEEQQTFELKASYITQ